MSTRFDSRKNNPNSQTLTSKRKVLREFQKMQEQLRGITEEMVLPEGEELFEEGLGVSIQFTAIVSHLPMAFLFL